MQAILQVKHMLILIIAALVYMIHVRIQEELSEGASTQTTFFFFFFLLTCNHNREDPNTTKSGPSSANQRNAI